MRSGALFGMRLLTRTRVSGLQPLGFGSCASGVASCSNSSISISISNRQATDRPILRLLPRRSDNKGGDARASRGFPWIFRDEAANIEELRASGQPAVLANVETSEGRELGSAVCNLQKGGATGNVNILARMVADNINLPIDHAFFAHKIRMALQHRESIFGTKRCYRLLNGEGDQLPGVICDVYCDVLVLQFTSAAMEILFEQLVLDALEMVMAPRATIVHHDARIDRQLELAPSWPPVVARGEYQSPTDLPEEDDLVFSADLLAPDWVSGRFFVERPQRIVLATALAGLNARRRKGEGPPRMLSLFGESSGVLGALKGCNMTCVVGLGEVSMARLEQLARRNRCWEGLECLYMEAPQAGLLSKRLGTFDIVTLEPPAFAPTYGKVEEGMQKYAAWIGLAASAVKPGGLLLVACRSRAMSIVKLMRSINLGIWSARRKATLVKRSSSGPPDFPVHASLLDTNEMQFLALRLT